MNDLLAERISALKKQKKAVILAHNYQLPEIQDIADITGDSLELARRAMEVKSEVIVMCGVKFMAEAAHILNPERTVIMPDSSAGCPLADMIDHNDVNRLKEKYPGSPVMCYVNSTAEVKAASDIACTSANAVKIALSLKTDLPIIFVPDQHLGKFVARKTGLNIITGRGFCPAHRNIRAEDIASIKARVPDALVIAHPECTDEVVEIADFVCSTSQMYKTVEDNENTKNFIIGTETGMLYPLKKCFPDRNFISPSEDCVCKNMKKITLESIASALEELISREGERHPGHQEMCKTATPGFAAPEGLEIRLPEDIRLKALGSLKRMMEFA